jgi:predicted MFS family arabinose efflux permease
MTDRTTVSPDGAITADGSAALASARQGRTANPWIVVVFLLVVAVLNLIDRFLPAALAEPMKADLQLSDTALGLINGVGFLVLYALAGIPIARLSDRGLYGAVVGTCVALWSVMTFVGGLAQTGWQLAATRMGVALGEAGSLPAAHAYISRNFAPDKRAAPLAVLTLYVPFGATIALLLAGFLGERLGWRGAFMVMGAAGLLLTPLAFLLVRNARISPSEEKAEQTARAPILPHLKKPGLIAVLIASALIGVTGYSTTLFAPAFLMRSHGLTLGEVGMQYGLMSGVTGIIGLLSVGALADRLSGKDPRWLLGVVAALIFVLLPFSVAAFLVRDSWAAVICVSLSYLVQNAYMAPVIAAMHRLVPARSRATASAILLFVSATVGSFGPAVTGRISDVYEADLGAGSLAHALLIVVPAGHLLAGLFYLFAALRLRKDMAPEEAAAA